MAFSLKIGTGFLSSLGSGLVWIGVIIAVSVVGFWMYNSMNKKKTFRRPTRITRVLENGLTKEMNGFGGEVEVGGTKTYRVKIPKKKGFIDVGFVPDYSLADADNRVHLTTIGEGGAYQQVKQVFQLTEEVEKEVVKEDGTTEKVRTVQSLVCKPVPAHVKAQTLSKLRRVTELLDKKKIKVFTMSIIAIVIMVIAHLISLYIQTKIKCGVPAP